MRSPRLGRLAEHGATPIVLGNLVGAGVAILGLPLIAYLYNPAVYGKFATMIAVLTVVHGVSSLRLDQKIPYAEQKEVPPLARASAYLLAASSTTALAIGLLLVGPGWLTWEEALLFGLGVCLFGFQTRAVYLHLRDSAFRRIGLLYAWVPTVQILWQLLFGLLHPTVLTLLSGYCAAKLAGLLVLGRRREHDSLVGGIEKPSWGELYAFVRQQGRWWRPLTLGSLANTMGMQMVIPLTAIGFGAHAAGTTALWLRVLTGPSAVVGTAVGQWFSRELHGRSTASAAMAYRRLVARLSIVSAVTVGGLALLAMPIQGLVLPAAWRIGTGALLGIALFAGAQLITAPGVHLFGFLGTTRIQLLWEVMRAVVTILLLLALPLFLDYGATILVYGVVSAVVYASQYYLAGWAVRQASSPGEIR